MIDYKEIDPFNEEDWEELDLNFNLSFTILLDHNYIIISIIEDIPYMSDMTYYSRLFNPFVGKLCFELGTMIILHDHFNEFLKRNDINFDNIDRFIKKSYFIIKKNSKFLKTKNNFNIKYMKFIKHKYNRYMGVKTYDEINKFYDTYKITKLDKIKAIFNIY